MKPRIRSSARFSLPFASALAALLAAPQVHATDYTWTKRTGSLSPYSWLDTGNWDANGIFASGSGNTLIFSSTSTTGLWPNGFVTITSNVPTTLSMNTLTLGGTGATGNSRVNIASSASTWTIGNETTSVVNLLAIRNANGTGTMTYNINANVALNQTTTTFTGNGSGTFSFNGVVSSATSGNGITKSGTSTLTLTNAGNTYNGATLVNEGTLRVTGSIGSSAVTVSNAGTVLASGVTGTVGNTVTINNGAILAPAGNGAAYRYGTGTDGATGIAYGTATALGATTFNNGSIFSWDVSANGASFDKFVAPSLVDGGGTGGSVFRIVVEDATFANPFWNSTPKTWTNIFTTDGSSAIANWANIFTTVSVVQSDLTTAATLPSGYSFTLNGNTLSYSAIPEPGTALAGLLLGAGLLRRRRK